MNEGESATVEEILRGTAHALTIFKPTASSALPIFIKRNKPYLTCYATGKERPAKPEEIVRQLYVKMLIDDYGYPVERIAIEKPVQFGSAVHEKAADIVVWDKDDPDTAFIVIECKKPKRADGLEQLKSYCHAEGAPIGVWTNGGETRHDVSRLVSNSDFISLSDPLKARCRGCYEAANPRTERNLISGDDEPIQCGTHQFRCGPEFLFAGVLEAIYLMRCSLFHGELVPTRDASDCYEPAYRILRRFLTSID